MAQIRVQDLQKAFGDFIAVKASTFIVEDGEFFCLLGPSGCGKTTTLRMIAGLELPTGGSIHLGGDEVAMKRASERDIAFVFQLFALYPHMNVRKNIGFSLGLRGRAGRRDSPARRGGGEDPAHRPSSRQARLGTRLGRPAARGARPRHRPQAEMLPDGRAAWARSIPSCARR